MNIALAHQWWLSMDLVAKAWLSLAAMEVCTVPRYSSPMNYCVFGLERHLELRSLGTTIFVLHSQQSLALVLATVWTIVSSMFFAPPRTNNSQTYHTHALS
jgi:hypothetical protein